MKVIKEYVKCAACEGDGIETNGRIYGEEDYRSWECETCQGYGKYLVSKEVKHDRQGTGEYVPQNN